jgi:hypothetical protein
MPLRAAEVRFGSGANTMSALPPTADIAETSRSPLSANSGHRRTHDAGQAGRLSEQKAIGAIAKAAIKRS